MTKISIAFSRAPKFKESLKSRIIRWFEKSNFSHALVVVNDTFVFQAVGHGVETISLDEFLKERVIVEQFDFEIDEIQKHRLDGFIYGSVGDEYSQSQLLGIVFAKWAGIEGRMFKNGTDKYICSELAAETLRFLFGFFKGTNLDLMTPKDLRDFLSNRLKKPVV